jgi:hypothetical protein
VANFLRASPPDPLAAAARRLVWWKSPEAALEDRVRLLAQIMTYGGLVDVRAMLAAAPEQELREVLRHAPPGVFDARSWAYWHVRLGLPAAPLPARRLPPWNPSGDRVADDAGEGSSLRHP